MNFPEKNNFILKHASAKHFDADKALYKKIFPESRLNPELDRANQYNKEHLDERMLMEVLGVVCGETVLENRTAMKPKAEVKEPATKEVPEKTVAKTKQAVSKPKPKSKAKAVQTDKKKAAPK